MSVQNVKNKLIGLTGGIASGKSTVSQYLLSKGYQVIDSDKVVHELWNSSQKMNKEVINLFELDKNSDVREQLRSFVFKNPESVKLLNQIVHPYVFDEIERMIKTLSEEKIIFIDMPLLFEVGYQTECDETWLVYVPQSIQIKRLMKRDHISFSDAIERIGVQMDIEEKKMITDYIIDNRKSKHHLYQQIDHLLERASREE